MKTRPFYKKLILIACVGVLLTPIGASRGMEVPTGAVPVDSLPPAGRIDGRTFAVVVAGSFAYLGVESRLIVVDIANPVNPRVPVNGSFGATVDWSVVAVEIQP